MERTPWIKLIKKLFGNKPFTLDELDKKAPASRAKVVRGLAYHTNSGNLKRLDDGRYQIGNGDSVGSRSSQPALRAFVKLLSQKYGDEQFSLDKIMEHYEGKRTSLHARMNILAKEQNIRRISTGVYRLTDKGHNLVVDDFKKEYSEEKKKAVNLPSCILMKMEKFLGKEDMRDWVYAIVMVNEECVGVLEEEAVRAIVKN